MRMISNEECRSFANNLRYISQHPPEWATSACAIAEVFDADYPLWADSGELFAMLADLIDRPMTRNLSEKPEFVCELCGAVWPYDLGFTHCPECGAEVAE